jgi:hypothetical protein
VNKKVIGKNEMQVEITLCRELSHYLQERSVLERAYNTPSKKDKQGIRKSITPEREV